MSWLRALTETARLAARDGEGVPDRVVRTGAAMLLEALEDLSRALDDEGPRPREGTAARA
ncbi:hypothetical protein [Streptomyces sp. NPDC055287]